ncbi:MAG: hypothetical protein M3Y66_02895 [Actinomycetota bacterium]|nr:hypothetical protein [Actinomycetota bacterium]
MKRRTTLAMASLALLASGCGQQAGTSSPTNAAADKVGSCAPGDAGVVHALPVYATLDLDHDGVGNTLMVTRPDSTCPNVMFSKVAGHVTSVDLGSVQLTLDSARRVIVPGHPGDLVAIREVHPRGGFQLHLYGYAGGKLAEVTTPDGAPPMPFVATDTKGGYLSASCIDHGFVLRQAVTHRPPGVVFAWDIKEASYRLDGTTAKPGGVKEIKNNVLDQELAKTYPALVKRQMFVTGCG